MNLLWSQNMIHSSCLIVVMRNAFQYGFVINHFLHMLYKLWIFFSEVTKITRVDLQLIIFHVSTAIILNLNFELGPTVRVVALCHKLLRTLCLCFTSCSKSVTCK